MMDIIELIYKVSAPVLTITTIVLTCYIHRISTENNKKDCYFQYIIDLYYRIEDDSCSLFNLLSSYDADDIIKQCRRRISVNCTLMAYYLRRFPGYYEDRNKFERILLYISEEPTKREYYDILSSQFENFCWGVRKNKKSTGRYIIDLDKIGYPDINLD